MNIIVINLTRFGDQLQSQAAINAMAHMPDPDGKKVDDKNRICLVTIADFASSGAFLKNASLVYSLPGDGFLYQMAADWPKTVSRLWAWRNELWKQFKPDLVCNLTPSVSASLLGRFLGEGTPLTGFGLDEFGFAQENPWASFLRTASKVRTNFPFNIVDIFRGVAGSSRGRPGDFVLRAPEPETDEAKNVRAMLAEAGGEAKFIAFQLGASEERRRWPTEYFAALGQAVWKEFGYVPLLLGGKGEAELALEYAAAAAAFDSSMPHLSLIGRTNLQELALALKNSQLLVSNDTGTMHMAAGLGVPVLGFFVATAQAWDTGPYLEGCCSLEPGLDCHPCNFIQSCQYEHKCRRAITPEAVIPLCAQYVRSGCWAGETLDSIAREHRPRAWVSRRDEYGFMELESISGHEQEARTIWFREQRIFLRQFLDRDREAPFRYAEPATKFNFPESEREKLSQELALIKAQLTLLIEIGAMLQKKPLPPLSERFIAVLHKASTAFLNSSYLISLGQLWQVEVQERGDELSAALLCIKQYYSLISLLLQRVEN